MLLFLLTRPPDIAISANVFAFSKKPIPSFRAIFSGTQAKAQSSTTKNQRRLGVDPLRPVASVCFRETKTNTAVSQSRREMSRRSSVSVTDCVSVRPSGRLISSFVTFVRRRTFPSGSVSNTTEIVPETISAACS